LRKRITECVLLLLIGGTLTVSAVEPISFEGGFTRAVMREGRETILLTQGAVVESGSVRFEAETIELVGPASRYVIGTNNVQISDKQNGLIITSNTISFDRETEQLLTDGWVEIQDLEHEVIASGAYFSYSRTDGLLQLQIAAKLLRHTDKGAMVCRADSIEYDRNGMFLSLLGGASIEWKGDSYQASVITVDLNTNEIVMKGTIKGNVNG